jgi:hypothetical protein
MAICRFQTASCKIWSRSAVIVGLLSLEPVKHCLNCLWQFENDACAPSLKTTHKGMKARCSNFYVITVMQFFFNFWYQKADVVPLH